MKVFIVESPSAKRERAKPPLAEENDNIFSFHPGSCTILFRADATRIRPAFAANDPSADPALARASLGSKPGD